MKELNERSHLESLRTVAKVRYIVGSSMQSGETVSPSLPNCQGQIKKRFAVCGASSVSCTHHL